MRANRLHPLPDTTHQCPYCRISLSVVGWHIPGMRCLADLRCAHCRKEFYGDLAAGQALYTPMLLEKESGVVHDAHGVEWFAGWLHDSYAQRTDEALPFDVQERLPITRHVVVLNCLDTLYGHSLLKLLNAQHYLDHQTDVDLILLVPSFLAWMIPEGAAQVWLVDLPLRRGIEWNDWLAREIRRRVEQFESVSLSHALSHPRLDEFNIERFTRARPFPLDEWEKRLTRPMVTFIWRDDRQWSAASDVEDKKRLSHRQTLRDLIGRARDGASPSQHDLVSELAEELRKDWPTLDFAVTGLCETGNTKNMAAWIEDMRSRAADEAIERDWCERFAMSHVVVGVHGSNMLLPSAHAGSVVELLGPQRWGNFAQDVLFRDAGDCRETFFRYRFIPDSSSPHAVAQLVGSILGRRESFRRLMNVAPYASA